LLTITQLHDTLYTSYITVTYNIAIFNLTVNVTPPSMLGLFPLVFFLRTLTITNWISSNRCYTSYHSSFSITPTN